MDEPKNNPTENPPDPETGTALAARPPAGVPRSAEEVFHQYAARVYNLARRMLDSDADAEDVTQDVLLQVVRKLSSFRGDSAFTTWLHRITVNAALASSPAPGRPAEAPGYDAHPRHGPGGGAAARAGAALVG